MANLVDIGDEEGHNLDEFPILDGFLIPRGRSLADRNDWIPLAPFQVMRDDTVQPTIVNFTNVITAKDGYEDAHLTHLFVVDPANGHQAVADIPPLAQMTAAALDIRQGLVLVAKVD